MSRCRKKLLFRFPLAAVLKLLDHPVKGVSQLVYLIHTIPLNQDGFGE
ncbi:hypothetical protein ACFTAO_22640 [Paenibacillus rhizoplanae]